MRKRKPVWGRKDRLGDQTWEGPVLAQVAGIALDDVIMTSVVAALGSTKQPVAIDRARIDRQIRELALEHAGGLLGDDTHLARMKVLRDQRGAIVERTAPGLPGQRAIEWLRALGESLQRADVPKEQAELMHAIYERITVAGPEIVGVRLTQAAYTDGLALALPEKVEMARPTGVGHAAATYEIPTEGRDALGLDHGAADLHRPGARLAHGPEPRAQLNSHRPSAALPQRCAAVITSASR
jgi:hypothetical protein